MSLEPHLRAGVGEVAVVHVVIREVLAPDGGGLPNAAEPLQEPELDDGENDEQRAEAAYELLLDEAGLL